ncbi:MAG: hemerythrin domain-containing protein [Armatimonadota bacterium]
MYATQELRKEHEPIKVALAVLDRVADDLEGGRSVDPDDIEQLIDFLKTFADRCHHGKEEDLLLPAMEKAGTPREGGPIGAVLADHVRGREYIRAMSEALSRLRAGDRAAPSEFAAAAHGYVSLLEKHIEKEDDILFPMADHQLSRLEHARLLEGFERVEQERIGPGVHERYHEMLDRFQEKYLSSRAA